MTSYPEMDEWEDWPRMTTEQAQAEQERNFLKGLGVSSWGEAVMRLSRDKPAGLKYRVECSVCGVLVGIEHQPYCSAGHGIFYG